MGGFRKLLLTRLQQCAREAASKSTLRRFALRPTEPGPSRWGECTPDTTTHLTRWQHSEWQVQERSELESEGPQY